MVGAAAAANAVFEIDYLTFSLLYMTERYINMFIFDTIKESKDQLTLLFQSKTNSPRCV